ncbi:MAG: membrane protein insertion efficiency factor YidD [Oligoflexales bacterium]|nr:membrane protein insertion efficiency factor YidD [Oligoflexales bacterium]
MIGHFLVTIIRCYQITISPFLGYRCRFYPSCSNYAIACLQKYSLMRALIKVIFRVVRCNPWHPGGIDLP